MSETFSQRLKTLRKAANVTQERLAESLGVHVQTVSKWERGINEPDFSLYGEIAATLNVPLGRLFGLPDGGAGVPQTAFDGKKFSENLTALRKANGEDQKTLAAALNVSSDTVSKWERGIICPSADRLIALSEHFGVELSALYFAVPTEKNADDLPDSQRSYAPAKTKPRIFKRVIFAAVSLLVIAAICTGIYFSSCYHTHSFGDWVTVIESSCTRGGYRQHTCTECGETYGEAVAATGSHTYGEWVTVVANTCTSDGYRQRTCTTCGTVQGETVAAAHTVAVIPSAMPTCTENGYTEGQYCAVCGEVLKERETLLITAHDFGEWVVTQEATAEHDGRREKRCKVCNTLLTSQTITYTGD